MSGGVVVRLVRYPTEHYHPVHTIAPPMSEVANN
jgi:hypothetical protein